MGFFFSRCGVVSDVSIVNSKAGIATSNVEVSLTVIRKNFMAIPNILTCRSRPIYVVVEGRRPFCWASEGAGYLLKAFPGR